MGGYPSAKEFEIVEVPCSNEKAARIGVYFSGATELNGKPVSLKELAGALSDKNRVTEVCYHRERPTAEEAPRQTDDVIRIIANESLPISFYVDSTFKRRVRFRK